MAAGWVLLHVAFLLRLMSQNVAAPPHRRGPLPYNPQDRLRAGFGNPGLQQGKV
jgi:hypothetical protein